MTYVLLQGVVMAKPHFELVDAFYSVKTITFGFLKRQRKKVIVKDNLFGKDIFDIENFNPEGRYYDAIKEQVMYKPHCDLYLSNQSRQTKYFESKAQLIDFIEWLKKNNTTIEL